MSEKRKEIKQGGTVIKSNLTTWVCQETGEVITAAEILRPVGRQGFVIAYLSTIIEMIETLGNKKMQVVKHILRDMDKGTNTYLTSTRELAVKTGVSTKTVTETLKLLENAKIITRRLGAIMVNPLLLHQGREAKERALLTRFYSFSDSQTSQDKYYDEESQEELEQEIQEKPQENPQDPKSHEDYIRIAKTTNKKVGWAYYQAKDKGLDLLDSETAQKLYDSITS